MAESNNTKIKFYLEKHPGAFTKNTIFLKTFCDDYKVLSLTIVRAASSFETRTTADALN